MKKWILAILLATNIAHANIRPVASAAIGLDFADFRQTQNIVLLAPYANTYLSQSSDNQPAGNLFLGIEYPIYQAFFAQLGLSYFQSNRLGVNGTVYQFAEADLGNLYYYFKVNSRRVMLEGKLFATVNARLHPYIALALGRAANTAYGYHEQPITTADVPMAYSFASRTYHSFAYALGFGADYDLSENVRLGGSYRFSNVGNAGLGTIPAQGSASTLKYSNLVLNEFLLQVTYVG